MSILDSVVDFISKPFRKPDDSEKRQSETAELAERAAERRRLRDAAYSSRQNGRGLPRGIAPHMLARAESIEARAMTNRLERYSERAVLTADAVLETVRQVRKARHLRRLAMGKAALEINPADRRPRRRARRALFQKSCRPSVFVAELRATREARGF